MGERSHEIYGVTVHWDDEEMTEAEALLGFFEASMMGALSRTPAGMAPVMDVHISLHYEERARREAARREAAS